MSTTGFAVLITAQSLDGNADMFASIAWVEA